MYSLAYWIALLPLCSTSPQDANRSYRFTPFPAGTGSTMFSAMTRGPDGSIYIGTCNEKGGGASLLVYEPGAAGIQAIADMQYVTGEYDKQRIPQSKIHTQIVVDGRGRLWFGTHCEERDMAANGLLDRFPKGYLGGHLISYDPRGHTFTDHGIPIPQQTDTPASKDEYGESLLSMSIDPTGRMIYAVTHPHAYLLRYDIEKGDWFNAGTLLKSYPHSDPKFAPSRALRVMADGRVCYFNYEGELIVYDPTINKLDFTSIQIPGSDGAVHNAPYALAINESRTAIYGSGAFSRHLFELVCRAGQQPKIKDLGLAFDRKKKSQIVVHAITAGSDGNVYYAADWGSEIYCYDLESSTIKNLGKVSCLRSAWGACSGPDGTLYLAGIGGSASQCGLVVASSGIAVENMQLSKRVPKQGDSVDVTCEVVNYGDDQIPIAELSLAATRSSQNTHIKHVTIDKLKPSERRKVTIKWDDLRQGTWRLAADLTAGKSKSRAIREVPVTAKDLYFVWYGRDNQLVDTQLSYATVGYAGNPEGAERLRKHGMVACAWKGFHPEKGIEGYRNYLDHGIDGTNYDAIMLDEFAGRTKAEEMKSLVGFAQARPNLTGFVYTMWHPQQHEIQACRDCNYFIMPEVYTNSIKRGRYGPVAHFRDFFDKTAQLLRQADYLDKTILAVSVFQWGDRFDPATDPSVGELEEQVRYWKTIAPEAPGIGFFHVASKIPAIVQVADYLCYKYYIKPVLTVEALDTKFDESTKKLTVSGRIRNVGGMKAAKVSFDVCGRETGNVNRATREVSLDSGLKVNETRLFRVEFAGASNQWKVSCVANSEDVATFIEP